LNAWASIPALGAGVGHDTQEGVRQALLQNPVFSYPTFQPVEAELVVTVSGASVAVGETTRKLAVSLPPNTSGVLYRGDVQPHGGTGGALAFRHKPSGQDVAYVQMGASGVFTTGQAITAPNNGNVTYYVTKGTATTFDYAIYIVGFFRSY
jgi:hypothetical protein